MARAVSALFGTTICFLVSHAFAQDVTDADFVKLDKLCRARQPAGVESDAKLSKRARDIRSEAIRQHETFVGNRVDHSGRMVFFGHAESESDQEIKGQITAQQLPWREVMLHWEAVTGKPTLEQAHEELSVWHHPGALTPKKPDDTLNRSTIKLGDILKIVDGTTFSGPNADRVKSAIMQSLMRAALSDVAWSAAFVSHVMKAAGVDGFEFSGGHIVYIAEAIRQSRSDIKDGGGTKYYRACDSRSTKPRVGDLYCYHRHVPKTADPYVQEGPILFRSIFRSISKDEKKIRRTHCDIVVRIDAERSKVVVIGGNVQNSVTEKTLNITRDGVLSPTQETSASKGCGVYNPDIKDSYDANCNLNKQEWFVLLQARS